MHINLHCIVRRGIPESRAVSHAFCEPRRPPSEKGWPGSTKIIVEGMAAAANGYAFEYEVTPLGL